ncbi:MAG: hypothetical protein ACLQG5_12065 [Methanobacterium sp.]
MVNVIVVGSGTVGSIIVREHTKNGFNVTILESKNLQFKIK